MRKIGLRNIKTAISVFITLMIYLVLVMIFNEEAYTWYSPFFASIAAAYSMQSFTSKSFLQARIRALGSLVVKSEVVSVVVIVV